MEGEGLVIDMQEGRAVRARGVTVKATGMQVIASKDTEIEEKKLDEMEKQVATQVVAVLSETDDASEVESLKQAVADVTAEKEERRQSAAEFQEFLFKEREADAKLTAERPCASLLGEVAMMEEAQRAAEDAAATAQLRIEVLETKVADADACHEAMSQDASESTQQLSDKLCAAQDELSKVSASLSLYVSLKHTHTLTLSLSHSLPQVHMSVRA